MSYLIYVNGLEITNGVGIIMNAETMKKVESEPGFACVRKEV